MVEIIEVRNLSVAAEGKKILSSISMEFDAGKIYTILGKNGSGKTTFANCMMGIQGYEIENGGIYLDGLEITNMDVHERAKLGITKFWQDPPNYRGITVKEYLTLDGRIKITGEDLKEVFDIVGMEKTVYENRLLDSNLSGGERKRIELASILILSRDYTVMDEPDSGIDLMSLEVVINALKKLKSRGKTTILITHREEIAMEADFSYLVCDGKIIRKGSGDEVISYYKNNCDTCKHPNTPDSEDVFSAGSGVS